MTRPFSSKTFRDKLESRLEELANQTEELRREVVERAPGMRDQILEQAEDLRREIVQRAPSVRDQLLDALPDKEQLLDLRDDLFEKLPENVQDKLPEKARPKRSRLKRVAVLGALTGAGAAAFAALRRRGTAPTPAQPFPAPSTPPPARPTPATPPTDVEVEVVDVPTTANKATSANKSESGE
jgi:AcrR family transcriptional regulator